MSADRFGRRDIDQGTSALDHRPRSIADAGIMRDKLLCGDQLS